MQENNKEKVQSDIDDTGDDERNKGILVLPIPLKAAASKLYKSITGSPPM